MIRIALVGDVGSGKSYVARLFGYPTFNADNEVAKIYKIDRYFFKTIKKKIPGYFSTFPLKKKELINSILDNKKNLKIITDVVHPLIKKRLNNFIKTNRKKKIVILDIPLYLENKLDHKKDIIIFVQSKKKDILKRLIKRPGYNKSLINIFRKIQLPIEKKKIKSNFIIINNFTKRSVEKYVKDILKSV